MNFDGYILLGMLIATLGTLIVNIFQNRELSKQRWIEIYSHYTKRYADIISNFPENINEENFDLENNKDYRKIMRNMRLYFDLCYEEYMLHKYGKLDKKLWKEWEKGMKSAFGKKAFRDAWYKIKRDTSYPMDFVKFVEYQMG
ncbi:MAG TPA: hypothetical protein ENI52_05390 [Thermoplasmata archaeon]|nr:hypothetical protein [Thermoplasmata archaeon]